jgi:putative ABC transport system permease protein
MTESVRQRIRQVDPTLPVYDISSIRARLEAQEAPQRLNAAVVGLYALMALIFALLGLYGMQAYAVIRRTREIGLRVALGAKPTDILPMIMAKALAVVGLGLALGVVGAVFIARFLEGVLYGTSGRDPVVFLVVVAAFCLVAGLAAFLPARRALRVEPIRALQVE